MYSRAAICRASIQPLERPGARRTPRPVTHGGPHAGAGRGASAGRSVLVTWQSVHCWLTHTHTHTHTHVAVGAQLVEHGGLAVGAVDGAAAQPDLELGLDQVQVLHADGRWR
jgi:hypothetical protein